MAKIILGPMVGQASGKIGGMVFSRNRGGTYVRRRAHPTTNTSPYSEAVKAAFASVSTAWGSLDAAGRQAWQVWSANNPIVDRVGQKITLDGHAAYCRVNCFRELIDDSLLDLPPVVGPPAGLQSLSVDGAMLSGTILASFTPSQATTSMRLALQAAVKESTARQYVNGSFRHCGVSDLALTSTLDVITLVEDRLGTLQNGDVLHIKLSTYDPASGLRSLPLSASAEISAIP